MEVRARLVLDRALSATARASFALTRALPENAKQGAGGAAGGVWGGMPRRPPLSATISPFSGDSEFFGILRRVRDSNPRWVAPHTLSKRAH